MGAAIGLRNVVGEAQHLFLIAAVPLHGDFAADHDAAVADLGFAGGVEHVGMQHRLRAIDVFDEALHTTGEGKVLGAAIAFVDQFDLDAVVQEREFTNALGQHVIVEIDDVAEDFLIGREMDFGAAPDAVTDHFQWGYLNPVMHFDQPVDRCAAMEFHEVFLAVAMDSQAQPFRQGVYAGHTDAVQAAGYLVAVLVELPAGMQHHHDDLGSGTLGFVLVVQLYANRNAASVVGHGNGVVRMDDYLDIVAIAGQRFVDGVVQHLEHHVMQAGAVRGVADVHAGTLAHRFQAFQLLNAVLVVAAVADWMFHVKPFFKNESSDEERWGPSSS